MKKITLLRVQLLMRISASLIAVNLNLSVPCDYGNLSLPDKGIVPKIGQKEYEPEVEFEYLDADVCVKKNDAGKNVTYIEEVLEVLEDDEKSESED